MSLPSIPDQQEPAGSWASRHAVLWFLIVAIGFVLFELSAEPALVAVAVCSKFGINDLLNGWWLRKSDEVKARGKVVSWFCFSLGLWKVATTALIAVILIFCAQLLFRLPRPPVAAITSAMLTLLVSFVLACSATWIGLLMARIATRKVWVDQRITESRRLDLFPPEEGDSNLAYWLAAASFLLPMFVFLLAALIFLGGAQLQGIRRLVLLGASVLIVPTTMIGIAAYISREILAKSWNDCWQEVSRKGSRELLEAALSRYIAERDQDPQPD